MPKIYSWIGATLLLGMVWLVYAPGLSGGFLFDDYANLPSLGAYGPVDNATTVLRYLTSGTADPTGRPVAVASFLLDARNWPADPHPFKRTNLILHLCNAALLMWLLTMLGRQRDVSAPFALPAAILGGGFWLLHPLFVSTTLYIVQREAMLPATFTLLGLLGYLHGRNRLLKGNVRSGALIASISIALATLLATLSKANGALLPLLVLVLEFTVLRPPSMGTRRALTQLRLWLLGVPTVLLLAYLALQFPADLGTIPGGRSWSYGQRLLTEPRVLLEYLRLLWLPRPFTTGLFNDQIVASTGLLRPWTTLPALLIITALPLTAWALRRRFPFFAAAILFYFAGHVLESTIIPLELYYEHRNYLPAMLMFWPLACWLAQPGQRVQAKAVLSLWLVLMLAVMTYSRSSVWGNSTEQALLWAAINPESPRANAYAAQFEMQRGQAAEAEQRLRQAISKYPDETQLTINLIGARCQQGSVSPGDLDLAARSLQTMRSGTGLLINWFAEALQIAQAGSCKGLNYDGLQTLLDAAWRNPSISSLPGRRQDLLHLRGQMALAQGNESATLGYFNEALNADYNPAIGLKQAALLGTAGLPCAGLAHLNLVAQSHLPARPPAAMHMSAVHAWLLQSQGYWSHEIRHLRATLHDDAQEMAPSGCPDTRRRPRNSGQ